MASTVVIPSAQMRSSQLARIDLGPYVLQQEIGRGGMGVVYRAVHKELHRNVAIKMISAGAGTDPQQQEMFLAEARAAALVRHPNVVGVYDVGVVHGWHYMAMEWIDGCSLAELVCERALEPNRAAGIALCIARAMQHLHEHGIIHRDIKPSNILIDARGVPYITDLGLAKVRELASALSVAGVVAGTPSYMSPEQATGEIDRVAQPSDIYSLGAVLYELLTARPPFRGKTIPDTLLQVMQREPVPPHLVCTNVPFDLENICLKCLEKEPGERYASMSALAGDLDCFLEGEPIAKRTFSVPQRLVRGWRRNPALAARFLCLWLFFVIEQLWYLALKTTARTFYLTTTTLVPLWTVSSIAFARAARKGRRTDAVRALWLATDAVFLTGILLAGEGLQQSPLVMLYPVLIVSSGFWNRIRTVWLATVLCVLSNLTLWLAALMYRPDLAQPLDVHLVFSAALVVIGVLVSVGVRQGKILRRYLPSHPLAGSAR